MRLIDADKLKLNFRAVSELDHFEPCQIKRILNEIDNAPTIKAFTLADIEEQYRKGLEKGLEEAERKHGEWKYHKYDKDYECPICNTRYDAFDLPVKTWDFCPCCGADMQANCLKKEGEANG